MGSATKPGTRAGYTQLIEAIYDAALDAAGWPVALDLLRVFVNADSTLLQIYRSSRDLALRTAFSSESTGAPGCEEGPLRENATVPFIESLAAGEMAVLDQQLPFHRLGDARFSCDYVKPQGELHVMGGPLLREAHFEVIIAFQRSHQAPAFGVRELTQVDRVVPHLVKALRLADCLERASLAALLGDRMLGAASAGMLLFDRQGRVVFLDPAAEMLLASQSQLTLHQSRLRARHRTLQRWLDTVTVLTNRDAHCPGWEGNLARFTAADRSEDVALAVRPWHGAQALVGPLARAVTAGILMPLDSREAYSVRLIQDLFGLTPGEARLTEALVSTGTLDGIAQKLGIKLSTVRDRLKAVFRKTGFTSQSALITAVLRSPTRMGLKRLPGDHWTEAVGSGDKRWSASLLRSQTVELIRSTGGGGTIYAKSAPDCPGIERGTSLPLLGRRSYHRARSAERRNPDNMQTSYLLTNPELMCILVAAEWHDGLRGRCAGCEFETMRGDGRA